MAKSSSHSVIAVELTPAYLKLVEFLPGENRVAAVAIEPLERMRWGNNAYLEERLKTALARHQHIETAELITSVGGSHSILRLVEIPAEEVNILDALHWDMEQYLSRTLEDYLMHYQALGSNATENGRLYLVAAHLRKEVERIQRLFESTGLPLTVLDVDALAALNAYEINYPGMQTGRTMLIKADSQAILCIRTHDSLFAGYDVIPLDADVARLDISTRAELFLELAGKIRACFDRSAETSGKIDHMVLCGDLVLQDKFREILASTLPLPLVSLDAFKEIDFVPGTEANAAFMPGAAQCAGVVGLALRQSGDC